MGFERHSNAIKRKNIPIILIFWKEEKKTRHNDASLNIWVHSFFFHPSIVSWVIDPADGDASNAYYNIQVHLCMVFLCNFTKVKKIEYFSTELKYIRYKYLYIKKSSRHWGRGPIIEYFMLARQRKIDDSRCFALGTYILDIYMRVLHTYICTYMSTCLNGVQRWWGKWKVNVYCR